MKTIHHGKNTITKFLQKKKTIRLIFVYMLCIKKTLYKIQIDIRYRLVTRLLKTFFITINTMTRSKLLNLIRMCFQFKNKYPISSSEDCCHCFIKYCCINDKNRTSQIWHVTQKILYQDQLIPPKKPIQVSPRNRLNYFHHQIFNHFKMYKREKQK